MTANIGLANAQTSLNLLCGTKQLSVKRHGFCSVWLVTPTDMEGSVTATTK
jgi:hypothetical protein